MIPQSRIDWALFCAACTMLGYLIGSYLIAVMR